LNVLAVIAHPDDEVLGCGGTLLRLADAGHRIHTCVLCGNAEARHGRAALAAFREEVARAHAVLGIADSMAFEFENIRFNVVPHLEMVQAVEQAIAAFRPEWLFTHHPGDLNVDHRICYEATMAAARLPERGSTDLPPSLIRRVYLMEILSSTDWTTSVDVPFQPNSHFDVSATFERKMRALECYAGALKEPPHPRSARNVEAHARYRGAQVGLEMAEAFHLVRDVNP
jgi:LmbE family N-acetylglucosaminyl deacetylase